MGAVGVEVVKEYPKVLGNGSNVCLYGPRKTTLVSGTSDSVDSSISN